MQEIEHHYDEMDIVCEMGLHEREKLDFLGCYFAFQLLNLNIRAVDVLRLDAAGGVEQIVDAITERFGDGSLVRASTQLAPPS